MKLTEKSKNIYNDVAKAKKELNEAQDIQGLISEIKSNGFAGDNASQMKSVQLLKGLATSDDPKANAFMKKIDTAIKGVSEDLDEKSDAVAYWQKVVMSTKDSIKSALDRAAAIDPKDDEVGDIAHYKQVAKDYSDSLKRAEASLKKAKQGAK